MTINETEMTSEGNQKAVAKFLINQKLLVTPSMLSKIKTIEEAKRWVNEQKDRTQDSQEDDSGKLKVLFNYNREPKRRNVQDFVSLFNARYAALEKILRNRQEIHGAMSIARLVGKRNREQVTFIGMVYDKQETKNGNIILTLEDPTGMTKVFVGKSRDLYDTAKDTMLDEVVGVSGTAGNGIIFANSLVYPDIPISAELKKAQEPGAMIVLSDPHVGNKTFLAKEFARFISWLNGQSGNQEQKELAAKVKYIFIPGDLVEGVGIYPGQEDDLEIKDIYEQYSEAARLLSKIPARIKIIIGPGNHDAVRISEPQPAILKKYAEPLLTLPNVTLVSCPATVNIHSSEDFSGFDVLLYHGMSFHEYCYGVDSIKAHGKHLSDKTDLVMRYLLQRRHLAPTYGSNLAIPESSDELVIENIPDFFISGHMHKPAAASYRGVSIICGSVWQPKTEYQEKVGHEPEPCVVPVVDLQTRQVTMLNFASKDRTKEKSVNENNN